MLTVRIPMMFFENRKRKFAAKVEQNGAIRTLAIVSFDNLGSQEALSLSQADFTRLAKDAAVITFEPVEDDDVTRVPTKRV